MKIFQFILLNNVPQKLQKVSHGMLRLTSRKNKRDMNIRNLTSTENQFIDFLNTNITTVNELINVQKQKHIQVTGHFND